MQRKADRVATPTIHIFGALGSSWRLNSPDRRKLAPIAATQNKVLNGAPTYGVDVDSKPANEIPEVPGIDLDYRPRDYFFAADLKIPLLSGIAGETRRQLVRELVEAGRPVPAGLDEPVLDEETRQAWGRVHPSNMGGEYLPPLRKGEVEIARISLQSVTCDQISVRARRSGKRIGCRIVDEYEMGYVCHPAFSASPLSLRELIALMGHACEGGIIFPALEINLGGSTPTELAEFITVSSDFYPDLRRYYRALTDAWLEERAREKSDES
jgi:hypothetical protein